MLKALRGAIIIIVMLSFPVVSSGEQDNFLDGASRKLTRGAVNAVTGAIEFPAEIVRGYERGLMGNKFLGMAGGILSGAWRFLGRTLSGAGDLVTFWAADHEDNTGIGIHMNNEYAWEDAEEPYDIFDPNIVEGAFLPVGRKLMRGGTDLLCGFMEMPGQIKKGASEGDTGYGVARGAWFWLSREASGARDIFMFMLPEPADNVGAYLDGQLPWE